MINIFGAGPTGSVIARRYAEKGEKVTVFEVRNHIAGNLYDYVSENGVIVHKYGPHIFQTSNDKVIEYIKNFAEWKEFRHKVNVVINGKEVPLPINFQSIDLLLENAEEMKDLLSKEFENRKVVYIQDLLDSTNSKVNEFGDFIFKNVFENYTTKMWGISPEEIDQSVLKRVPIRLSYDDGYFTDKFQAVPIGGYTKFISNILNHPNIEVKLNCPKDIIKIVNNKLIVNGKHDEENINIYTGPIDSLFDFDEGEVPYRSLKFVFEKKDKIENTRYVVNYPSHPTMTRITDYRLLSQQLDENILGTIIGKEYPGSYNKNSEEFKEPYYPINNKENDELINKYLDRLSKIRNIKVLGRLAEYKYKQMWETIRDALEFKI